jgi:TnpA family transposase
MSLGNSQPDEESVLRYRATGQGSERTKTPSPEELAFDWTLSENDKALAISHRGAENVCRFAVQLCVVRKQGRFLTDYSAVPPLVLGYLCQQLEIKPIAQLVKADRRNTESDYQQEITTHLRWQQFDDSSSRRLHTWIFDQVSEQLYVENLFRKVEAFLLESRIVIPGATVLEREVNVACRAAEQTVWAKLAALIPVTIRAEIDRLLSVTDHTGKSEFFRFAEYPPAARAKKIVEFLTRYEALAALKLETVGFRQINPALVRKLAAVVRTYDVWRLKRFEPDKKYALALNFLWDAKKSLLDYLVEMHAQFMTEMERSADLAWEEEHRNLRKRLKIGVASLRKFGSEAVALEDPEKTTVGRLFDAVPFVQVQSAISDCAAFEDWEQNGFLRKLHARYSNFRRYFPYFANLNFASDSGGEAIVSGLKLLRQLEQGELKALPEDVDVSFVPESWRCSVSKGSTRGVSRPTWEISLALALSEALRSGRVYLPESRHYVSFWDLCYDEGRWQTEKAKAYLDLKLPVAGEAAIQKLVSEFHKAATAADIHLATNPFASVVNGQLVVKKEAAVPHPEGTAEYKQLVERHLAQVRIERLIDDVDRRCGFMRHLKPLGQEPIQTPEHKKLLRAAATAQATNLGIFGMVGCTQGITVDQLQHVSRTCLHKESIHQANVELINFLRTLKHSRHFGEGTRSSSDGQRFGVQGSSLLSAFYPRYFGYYDRVVTVYTHMSDQFGVFSTQAISCAEREALYVLNGLLEHDTDLDIQQHFTDTHGFTEQLFGLCYLLGFSFMPRIKNFKKQDLYHPGDGQKHGAIDSLFAGKVDMKLIAEQWDSLVRIAASLKNRIVSAHVIAKRLINLGTTNPLAKALTQLGQLVKTTYLLRYMDDEELRRVVQLMLNRGEGRQYLAQHVFFANQGKFRTGDYFEIMNKANCLSLLSNAIMVWNTIRMGEILDAAEKEGKTFSPEALAHVQPLHFKHVIVNGTYDFTSPATFIS